MNTPIYKNEFWQKSVCFIPSLLDDGLISETKSYLTKNEDKIISNYRNDKRKLVVEIANGKELIKYFELPLSECFPLFGHYVNSTIFDLASSIMGENLRLVSLEVHSRNPGGSHIPLHQDNAYYGLSRANACTLFVPLSVSYKGNLRYVSNNPDHFYEHERSNTQAFSLQISREKLQKSQFVGKEIVENHIMGGAFLHHSHSVHFANNVPKNADRVWAIRLTFFGSKTDYKKGHFEWYNKIVLDNRNNAGL